MSAKHTPGPWAYRSMKGYCTQIDGANGHTICCFDEDPEKADAALIVAAPELLEAAQAAWNCIAELHPTQARAEVIQLLQAAIEKASGEQP